MKTDEERRRHTWTVVAIAGGGGVILLVLANHATGARAGPSPARASSSRGGPQAQRALNFAPNPATPGLDESLIAAREAALNTYDQSAVAERGVNAQYELGVNQDTTARAIAFNTNATQLKETGLTTTAEQTIAQEEEAAQEQEVQAEANVQSQYAQAQQTQASGSWWSNLLGGLGGIAGMLGFSMPAPTGYGVGYVDSNTGEPLGTSDPIYTPAIDPYSALESASTLPSIVEPTITLAPQPAGFGSIP